MKDVDAPQWDLVTSGILSILGQGREMTIGELKRILSTFDDNDLVLVEAAAGGFEEPQVYVAAIRQRHGNEFQDPFASEYVSGGAGATGTVVVGTSLGLLMTPF